jgi:putative SbcD/Mre11-related phosphoesterase
LTKIQTIQPHPAILLKKNKKQALVISDLHIGWEKLLTQKGIHLPSQTPKILNSLLNLIDKVKPTHLIILGDIKDAITNPSIKECKDIPELFNKIQEKVSEIKIIKGNHDGNLKLLLPKKIKTKPATGIKFEDVGLFHGHAWPSKELLQCKSFIMGHVHPTISIKDPMGFRTTKQVFVKTKCNAEKLRKAINNHLGKTSNSLRLKNQTYQLFIIPTFNQFLGGRPINEKNKKNTYIGPILRSGCANINNAEIYLLDGTFLGTISQLRTLT